MRDRHFLDLLRIVPRPSDLYPRARQVPDRREAERELPILSGHPEVENSGKIAAPGYSPGAADLVEPASPDETETTILPRACPLPR